MEKWKSKNTILTFPRRDSLRQQGSQNAALAQVVPFCQDGLATGAREIS
jgi:hypothetical protein